MCNKPKYEIKIKIKIFLVIRYKSSLMTKNILIFRLLYLMTKKILNFICCSPAHPYIIKKVLLNLPTMVFLLTFISKDQKNLNFYFIFCFLIHILQVFWQNNAPSTCECNNKHFSMFRGWPFDLLAVLWGWGCGGVVAGIFLKTKKSWLWICKKTINWLKRGFKRIILPK